MNAELAAPSTQKKGFVCPHCNFSTGHVWYEAAIDAIAGLPALVDVKGAIAIENLVMAARKRAPASLPPNDPVLLKDYDNRNWQKAVNLHISKCLTCNGKAIWIYDKMVHPTVGHPIQPNSDLPDDIARDFNEARQIVQVSPRGAAALLRLCIQKLCKHLGQPGKNINDDIGALVTAGLDARVQKALDIVRVIGNNAVHPGSMDWHDDVDTASQLFELVNIIADRLLSQPKQIEALYGKLPSGALAGVAKRDGSKP